MDDQASQEEPPLEDGESSLPPPPPGERPHDKSHSQQKPAAKPPPIGPTQQRFLLLSTWSLLIFATFWGVLGRLGLTWVGGFANRTIAPSVWIQIVGCLAMGFITERKKVFESMSVLTSRPVLLPAGASRLGR